MATRLKPIAHDDRLSLVEHLSELRTRVIICIAALLVAGGVCLWQEDWVLDTVNKPLADVANNKPCDETRDPLEQADCWQQAQKKVNDEIARDRDRRSPRPRKAPWRSASRRRISPRPRGRPRRSRRTTRRSCRSRSASASR